MALNVDEILEVQMDVVWATADFYNDQGIFGEPEWLTFYAAALEATRSVVCDHPEGGIAAWSKWNDDRARQSQRLSSGRTRRRGKGARQRWAESIIAADAEHRSTSP